MRTSPTTSETGQSLDVKAKGIIPGGTHLLSKRPELFLPGHWPSYFSRAEGARVWDLDGNCYIDMSHNGVGSCPLGYADPDVNAAVKDAVDRGNMSTLNCAEEVELAEVLCALHPWSDMARFARTGGESMAIAVRVARAHTGRSKVAFCGYHGWHDWYLAANLTEADSLGTRELHLPGLDPAGVPAELAGTAIAFRHNRLDELERVVRDHGDGLAAIVCEVQRTVRPTPGFLEGVRAVADRTGAVLVFDEISSSFRLNPGGVHLRYGVTPDIAVFAKALGNGYPIAAVIGTRAVMDSAQSTFISSTFWTERVGFAAALAMIAKYRRLEAHERMSAAGLRVQDIWRREADKAGLNVHVGHPDLPPMSHLDFEGSDGRAMRTLLCQLMLERGVLDSGAFYSTYAHTDDIIDQYADAVSDVFAVLADARKRGDVQQRLQGPVRHSGFQRLTS